MVTLEAAKDYVDPNHGDSTKNDEFIERLIELADSMVTAFIGTQEVPEEAKDQAVLETVLQLFHRRQSPNGEAQFSEYGTAVVRTPRDPMVSAYPVLGRYMVIGL